MNRQLALLAASLLATHVARMVSRADSPLSMADLPGLPTNLLPQATIFIGTNAPHANRISAAGAIATYYADKGDFATPEAFYKKCYQWPRLDAFNTPAIARAIVQLHYLQGDFDGAMATLDEVFKHHDYPQLRENMVGNTAAVYCQFGRYREAIDYCLTSGRKAAAAKIAASGDFGDEALAERLYTETLLDDQAPAYDRREAYAYLFDKNRELADRYLTFFAGDTARSTNAAIDCLVSRIDAAGTTCAYYGNFREVIHAYESAMGLMRAAGRKPSFAMAQYAAMAYCAEGDVASAVRACEETLALNPDLRPEERYQLGMTAGALKLTGRQPNMVEALAELDARHGAGIDGKERVNRIQRAGCAAVLGRRDEITRALETYRKSLYVPSPKRDCVVRFSEQPITGIGDWERLPHRPEIQSMDRAYGGSMTFLQTDVSTGDRGEGINTTRGAAYKEPPTMQIACDAWGLHFRFEVRDEKAREIEAGLVGGGSYEGYIAPGADQPYVCYLIDLNQGTLQFWNTSYDTTGHRRINEADTDAYRTETRHTDSGIITMLSLSWDTYADRIPSDGAVWDFENLLWGRQGKAAWNGTESIHGRSTWGRLVFEMPEKARRAILRRQIFRALAEYKHEKATRKREGLIDHWRDEVVGDPGFHAACVAPLVERLDGYAARVRIDMSDADVEEIAENALGVWHNLPFVIDALRRDYLERKLTASAP